MIVWLSKHWFYGLEFQLGDIVRELRKIKGDLEILMGFKEDLEASIQGVKTTVADGFTSIDQAVSAAADRVIASLQSGGDVSEQIAELNALKDDVSAKAQSEVDKVNAIDPPTPPADPTV